MASECLICFELIDPVISYYIGSYNAEHQPDSEDPAWEASRFCLDCVMQLKATQYNKFVNDCVNSSCERSMRRLMESGPPIYLHDEHGFPLAKDFSPVWLKYKDINNETIVETSRLTNAPIGDERLAVWNELKQFVPFQETHGT